VRSRIGRLLARLSGAHALSTQLAAGVARLTREHTRQRGAVLRHLKRVQKQQTAEFRRLEARLQSVEHHVIADPKRRDRELAALKEQVLALRGQLRALLRRQFLAEPPRDAAEAAAHRRFGYRSQHDEDGIVYALLQTVGMPTRFLVDIGCGDYGGNSSWLLQECGFRGLLIDASPIAVRLSQRQFTEARVEVRQATVSSRSVQALLAEHGVPEELDLLSIDVDGVDYWIWEAIAQRPRLVVIEYNSAFGPTASVTVPDADGFVRPPAGVERMYFGASLSALDALGRRKGYRLVLTDPTGTNALFIREDLAAPFPATGAAEQFRMYWRHREAVEDVPDLAAYFRAKDLPLIDIV
jgi:hypothetical protein